MISVLLVDDEPGLLELGTIFLEKTGEFSIATAPSAQNALEMMESARYDAIVSDYQMPGMDGIEFLKTIRSRDDITPFIIFTGKGREEVAIEALNAGADFYLQKGGNPKAQFAELANKIQYAVSRMRAEKALRESEERYRTVVETTGTALVVIEADTTISFANTEFENMTGFSKEEIEGRKRWTDFVVEEDLPRMLEQHRLRRQDRKKALGHYEFRLTTRTGKVRDMYLSIDVIPGTKKSIASLIDITDRKRTEEALRESEERYRTVIENAGEIIFVAQDGVLKFINRKTFELLQTPPESVIGKPFDDFIHPDDRAFVLDRYRRRMEGEDVPSHYEVRLVNKAGDMIWVILSAVRISWEGRPATLNFATDITARKRAEEQSRILAEMVDIAPSSITVHDYRGNFLFANQKTFDIHGYSRSEFLDLNLADLDVPESAAHIEEHMKRVAERGEDVFEVRHRRKDGSTVPMEVHIKQAEWSGKPAVLSIANDITERKHAEESLREREAYLSSIFRAAPVVIGLIRDRILIDANDRLCEITGYTLEEMIGQSARLLYPTTEEYGFVGRELYDKAGRDGTGTVETRWRRRDGTIRDILINSTALDPDDPERGVMFTALDITEQNRAWSAFRQTHRKLRILSGITRHNILNKLNVMNGYLDLLGKALAGDDESRGYLAHITRMSREIEQQIEFIRTYENLGSGEPEYQSLDAIIDDLDIPDTITVRTSGTGVDILAEPMLKQVFENLLGNTLNHGGDVSCISVTGEVSDGDLLVSWEDDGVGIPSADKEQIFEQGFGKNHGFGLFLVREILDLTGISIREIGEEGKGARFVIRVPSEGWRDACTDKNRETPSRITGASDS